MLKKTRPIRLCTLCLCVGIGIDVAYAVTEQIPEASVPDQQAAPRVPFSVVLPEEPKPWERSAVKELETWLSQAVGDGTAIGEAPRAVHDADERCARPYQLSIEGISPIVFHVGDTVLAKEKGLLSTDLQDEKWIIRSFGRDVVLNGGGSHGALYAVSHFLEDFVGVRFWNDEETDVPALNGRDGSTSRPDCGRDVVASLPASFAWPALNATGRPVFRYRDIYRCADAAKATPRFAIMRRLNRNGDAHVPQEWGGEFTYGPPYHCHTFDRMIPWKKYGKEHPEWFSLWDGKRTGGVESGQLCITNPEVRALLLKVLRENIAKGDAAAKAKGVPAPRVYELSMNDSKKYCQCEKCMAEVEKYDFSGFYLNLVNEIADEISKTRPELYFSMLTYLYSEPPPKGGVKPRDNVIVKLCDTRSNQAAPLTDPCNHEFLDFLKAWSAIANNLIIWDYAISFVNPSVFFPFASEFSYADTFRTFRRHNVFGVFMEHEYPYTDMYELKYYLESKLLEDPYQDANALIADFMSRYFGAAGKPILKARRHLDEIRRERGAFLTFMPQAEKFDFITMPDLEKMAALWDEAEAAVKDDAKRLARVRRARKSQDAMMRFRLNTPREVEGAFVFDAKALDCGKGPAALVKDAESPCGEAVRIPVDEANAGPFGPPLKFGLYDRPSAKHFYQSQFPSAKGESYEWFEFKDVKTPSTGNNIFYLSDAWVPNMVICRPGLNATNCTMRICAKFTGPRHHRGSKAENEVRIAQIVLKPISQSNDKERQQ